MVPDLSHLMTEAHPPSGTYNLNTPKAMYNVQHNFIINTIIAEIA
jgi:hypothetical protein